MSGLPAGWPVSTGFSLKQGRQLSVGLVSGDRFCRRRSTAPPGGDGYDGTPPPRPNTTATDHSDQAPRPGSNHTGLLPAVPSSHHKGLDMLS